MADSYVGEIRMFAGDYAPYGWAFCDGALLEIVENGALYALIGTTYGGDGRTNFQLPDLRGRVPIHYSSSYPLGMMAGAETVSLIQSELPIHTHTVQASNDVGNSASPADALWAKTDGYSNYTDSAALVPMSAQAISVVGGNQPHDNMMPSLTITFIIALQGIFPSQG